MKNHKVLVLGNQLDHEGGVVGFNNMLLSNFSSDDFSLYYFSYGSRTNLFKYYYLKRFLYIFYYVHDLIKFIKILVKLNDIRIVQINPSLVAVSLFRDTLFVLIAKFFNKKVIVNYHGWKYKTFSFLKLFPIKKLFNYIFQNNTHQLVLSLSFKNDLKILSKKANSISVITTGVEINNIVLKKNRYDNVIKVLFLGRIQKRKGILELVNAIIELQKTNMLHHFHFNIVGHEFRTGFIRKMIKKLIHSGVEKQYFTFHGRVIGKEKYRLYSRNDIFILPSYTEGCPVSVLEALCSGLICVTTPVGALNDIINKNNGLLIKKKNPDDIVRKLLYIYENDNLISNEFSKKISNESSKLYSIKSICNKYLNIYKKIVDER